jgi:hypothetical protein
VEVAVNNLQKKINKKKIEKRPKAKSTLELSMLGLLFPPFYVYSKTLEIIQRPKDSENETIVTTPKKSRKMFL